MKAGASQTPPPNPAPTPTPGGAVHAPGAQLGRGSKTNPPPNQPQKHAENTHGGAVGRSFPNWHSSLISN